MRSPLVGNTIVGKGHVALHMPAVSHTSDPTQSDCSVRASHTEHTDGRWDLITSCTYRGHTWSLMFSKRMSKATGKSLTKF